MDAVLKEAFDRFASVYRQVQAGSGEDAMLMVLATASREGRPSVRTVYFSGVVAESFSFFVNSASGKGVQLETNPQAALCFHWPTLGYQVVIDGAARVLADDVADKLWLERPRWSTLNAWASLGAQASSSEDSQAGQPDASSAADAEDRYSEARVQFDYRRVPRPPHWVGYGIVPDRIEFWHEGPRQRRGRESFTATASGWRHEHLNP